MTENNARDEICRIGASLYQRGYVHGTTGNISIRLDDGFLITPTDACLGTLDAATLARLDANSHQIKGPAGGLIASKTIALHACIYRAAGQFNTKTRCIIHTHSTHAVALSLRPGRGEWLPPITPYFVMKVGHVPLIAYHRPGDPEVAARVAEAISRYGEYGTPLRAVMLARLGPNVWHETPDAAMAVLEELEETARLCLLASPAPEPLTEAQIDELRQTFGARW